MTTGLVLEGGGMRGVYTGGVLDVLLGAEIFFPYIIGVSAGACNAVSYLSRQPGRNRRVTIDYIGHKEYISFRNWVRTGSVFGMDLIFNRIPNEYDPLDYDALFRTGGRFVIVTTDPATGKPRYFENDVWSRDRETLASVLKASSSLPFFAPPVTVDGTPLFDGGVTDPLPVRKALADGCGKLVVVLTKDASYRIKPFKRRRLAGWMYRKYPELVAAMLRREAVYNESMADIRRLEAEGRAFVIQPSERLPVGRMERNRSLLERLYRLGEDDAREALPKLQKFLEA